MLVQIPASATLEAVVCVCACVLCVCVCLSVREREYVWCVRVCVCVCVCVCKMRMRILARMHASVCICAGAYMTQVRVSASPPNYLSWLKTTTTGQTKSRPPAQLLEFHTCCSQWSSLCVHCTQMYTNSMSARTTELTRCSAGMSTVNISGGRCVNS